VASATHTFRLFLIAHWYSNGIDGREMGLVVRVSPLAHGYLSFDKRRKEGGREESVESVESSRRCGVITQLLQNHERLHDRTVLASLTHSHSTNSFSILLKKIARRHHRHS
jgi:hypothetical protein